MCFSYAYRLNCTPRVFSANEVPPEVTIFLHHEVAQSPIYPSKVFFFCQTAPTTPSPSAARISSYPTTIATSNLTRT